MPTESIEAGPSPHLPAHGWRAPWLKPPPAHRSLPGSVPKKRPSTTRVPPVEVYVSACSTLIPGVRLHVGRAPRRYLTIQQRMWQTGNGVGSIGMLYTTLSQSRRLRQGCPAPTRMPPGGTSMVPFLIVEGSYASDRGDKGRAPPVAAILATRMAEW